MNAIRECGTLIVALTPLDATFALSQEDLVKPVLFLLALGISLFAVSLLMERRRSRVS